MKGILEYIWICTQQENTRYKIIEEVKLPKSKKRWFVLENVKTGQSKEARVFWINGKITYLINEDILSDSYLSDRFLYFKRHGNTLLLEEKF